MSYCELIGGIWLDGRKKNERPMADHIRATGGRGSTIRDSVV